MGVCSFSASTEFLDGAGVVGGAEAVADPCGVGITVGQVGDEGVHVVHERGVRGREAATDAILAGAFDALAVGDADALALASADSEADADVLGVWYRLPGWSRLRRGR